MSREVETKLRRGYFTTISCDLTYIYIRYFTNRCLFWWYFPIILQERDVEPPNPEDVVGARLVAKLGPPELGSEQWIPSTSQVYPIRQKKATWMSQELSKWLVNGLYPQYTPFISRLQTIY